MARAKARNWYWEAEQDRIAADPALRLLSLECVGLFFLLMNEMWRSVRVGYLCDPVQQDVPLSDTELAAILGRDSAVVQRVLRVLLEREIFSKEKGSGIVFSRGIIRKENLRKKRASAGRKGGLRSHDLLKQTVEQNTEQSVRIGIGINSKSSLGSDFETPPFEEPARRLAFLYRSNLRGRKPEDETLVVQAFAEMLAMGATEEALTAYLKLGPPQRDRGEYLWQIKKSNVPEAGKPGQKVGLVNAARELADWAKEG